jgi:hypothetical protein
VLLNVGSPGVDPGLRLAPGEDDRPAALRFALQRGLVRWRRAGQCATAGAAMLVPDIVSLRLGMSCRLSAYPRGFRQATTLRLSRRTLHRHGPEFLMLNAETSIIRECRVRLNASGACPSHSERYPEDFTNPGLRRGDQTGSAMDSLSAFSRRENWFDCRSPR